MNAREFEKSFISEILNDCRIVLSLSTSLSPKLSPWTMTKRYEREAALAGFVTPEET